MTRKPLYPDVVRVEELRKQGEQSKREEFERKALEAFEADHDQKGTSPEDRDRAREKLLEQFDAQRKLDEERERKREQEFRELYTGPEKS